MCKTKSAVALPRGAGWRGGWMRRAGPILPGRVLLCVLPGRRCRLRADACGKRGGTWLSSEQVEPWECDRGDARCRVCSGKGNVRCRSPAVSLQVTGSGWRRVPVGWGGFASFISSWLRVTLVPWRWQSVVLWHSAQGPHCLAACITHASVAWAAWCAGSP